MLVDLMTSRGEELLASGAAPWQCYPRPQMRRDAYLNLNGLWAFTAEGYSGEIRVPFCPESILSGVGKHFPEGSELCYRREFTLPEEARQGRVLLHIGAADQRALVEVNGHTLCHHVGGYEAFTVDITEALQPENTLTIRCFDDLNDQAQPYGKQVKPASRGGMWYTPVSGLWQTVWLEWVPEHYIEHLHIKNQGYGVTIAIEPALEGRVRVEGLGEFPLENGCVTITPEDPRLWSPEEPNLYTFTVETETDRVESYFAIRCLEIKRVGGWPRLCLNGAPYFFHGLLDQGYWPEGLLTPPAPQSYADDILAMKKLGFNMLRKHIKVEPEEFYYQCDKLGMVVFQDMINNSDYSFFRDTALPTAGLQKLDDRRLHRKQTHRSEFLRQMESAVNQLKNHPCICYWTIFNEAWGQFDSDRVHDLFVKLDDTRFVDSTSGWFRRNNTDVDSRHVYFRRVKLKGDGKKPLVLSEFGGKTYRAEGHVFNPDKTYGYGGCETEDALNAAVKALYMEEILPCVARGLCAAVYTQVSDVEDEINGLLTYDRKVEKLRPETMGPVAEALKKALQNSAVSGKL